MPTTDKEKLLYYGVEIRLPGEKWRLCRWKGWLRDSYDEVKEHLIPIWEKYYGDSPQPWEYQIVEVISRPVEEENDNG